MWARDRWIFYRNWESFSSCNFWALRFKVSNNVLEFLSKVVSTWLGILNQEVKENSCIFSVNDNASAVGWTHKSSFSDSTQEQHISISSRLASLVIDHSFCVYSQHFTGWMNVAANCLSWDFHLDDEFLTFLLKFFFPTQLVPSFRIFPLPPEIISFIVDTLEASLAPPRWHQRLHRSTIAAGLDGVNFLRNLTLEKTYSWIKSKLDIELLSLASSPMLLEWESLIERLSSIWWSQWSLRL